MKTEPAVTQALPYQTLLAVTDAQDCVLYLSPDLKRLLGQGHPTGTLPWTVEREESRPGDVALASVLQASGALGRSEEQAPTLRQARVQLHRGHGAPEDTDTPSQTDPDAPWLGVTDQPSSAFLTSLLLPGTGVSLHSFQLERSAGALGSEQLRQLLDQLPVAAVGVGLNGELLYANARAIDNAQMPVDSQQYIGLNDLQYTQLRGLQPDRAQARVRHLQTVVREGRSVTWTDQVPRPGRAPEYWRRSYTPVYDEHGALSLIAGTGIHVSEEVHRTAELELLFQMVRNNPDAMLVVDLAEEITDSRIMFANRVAERLLGGHGPERRRGPGQPARSRPLLTGRTLGELADEGLEPDQRALLRRLLLLGHGVSGPIVIGRGTRTERCLEVSVTPGGSATSRSSYSHLCLSVRNITAANRARQLEQGRSRVLQLVLSGVPLQEVLTELAQTLETQLPGHTGAVMLLRGDQLYYGAAPGLPSELKRLADGRRAGPNAGVCALAVHLGQPVIAADLLHDPRFQNDWALARQFGIESLWSVPILGKRGQALGTFAVYGREPGPPRPRQLEILTQLADLTALLIEARQANDSLEQVAYHDALTGLPNRSAFMQTLSEQLRVAAEPQGKGAGRLAVALIDLSEFRAVNEAYGQAAGNRLLQQVAGRLQDALRGIIQARPHRTLPLLARLGGDEFALSLPQSGDTQELMGLGEQLLEALAPPFQVGEAEVSLRGSIGWSLSPDLANDAPTLLSQADTAMYTARQAGEVQQVYSKHGTGWSLSPTTISTALEGALDSKQLRLAYQPLMSRDGSVRGFEALLRWTHPQYGNIGPDQFIPVAEMSGLIRHIGVWVLEQATRAALAWPEHTLVNVNISGRQFEHPGFVAEVAAVLAQTGLPPTRLELELTESALMVGSKQATLTLQQLAALGVKVALDDYGVGYSNLMRLYALPIDTIKIDRSFTCDLMGQGEVVSEQRNSSAASAAIIRSVVGLAHDLGLQVVAEGIETPEQLAAVLALGCDAVQGYLYSRPLPAEEALTWVQARSAEAARPNDDQ